MGYQEVQDRFKNVIAASAGDRTVLNLQPAHLENIIDMPVLVGDDAIWLDADHLTGAPQTTAQGLLADRCAIVKIPGFVKGGKPQIMETDLMEAAHFGINVQEFPGDKGTPYIIESYYDDDDKVFTYDATGYNQLKILNASGAYVMAGVDDALV